MYFAFGIFLLIILFFFCISFYRRKKIIRKVCSMCPDEKCRLLNDLIRPFGYLYVSSQDIFSSRIDAWQRSFGYCALYDKAASHLGMIFDHLPVYFNYMDRTWLIEFWKGQYGINTGCEIGVYYADRILGEDEPDRTLFQCVDDKDMMKLSLKLYKGNDDIAHLYGRHWWLTAFKMGCFSNPSELSVCTRIAFPSSEMAGAFADGLIKAGYDCRNIYLCRNTVSFTFACSPQSDSFLKRLRIRLVQCINSFWCRIYLFITRPFCTSLDRILYLYYFLPFAFRRMLRLKRYKGRKSSKIMKKHA